MQMEGYYSSDDDVAWGPYTLREAKGDIRKTVPSRIERRHTHSGFPNKQDNFSEPITMEKSNQRFENEMANISQKMKSQLNISGTSSEYFTPNETLKSGPTSVDEFLDKMKKVIGDPTKIGEHNEHIPDKYTLVEAKSNMNEDIGLDEIISASRPQLANQRRQDNSIFNFLKMANPGRGKVSMLGNVEPTLVDNTVIISSDEEGDDGIVKREKLPDSYLVNNSCYDTSSEIEMIEISDTSIADASVTNLDNSFYLSDMKTEVNDEHDLLPQNNNLHVDNEDSEINSNEKNICALKSNASALESYSNVSRTEEGRHFQHHAHMQRDSVHAKNYTHNGDDEEIQFSSLESVSNDKPDIEYIIKRLSKDLQDEDVEADSLSIESVDGSNVVTSDFNDLKNVSINKKATSEIYCAPDIVIESYSESSSQNSSMAFNDTLEEMEIMLKYGLNYKMPNDSLNSPKNTNHNTSYDSNSQQNYQMVTPTPYISPVMLDDVVSVGSRIPKLICDNSNSNFAKNHRTPMNPNVQPEHAKGCFKVPSTPIRPKATPTKSPLGGGLNSNKKFKNIISPVGIYIKHSPAAVIKRTIVPKDITTSRSARTPEEKISKNIVSTDLPKVVYRPAKKNVIHQEKEIVLPQSIRKLICEPCVTKHEGRITSKQCDTSAGTMLDAFEPELTCASFDENALNTTGETSFLSKKQGFTK